jgi:exosome complex RNA-binding protein Csl4
MGLRDYGTVEVASPWKQMAGVAVAMEATLEKSGSNDATYRPQRILAVEPPVTDPDYNLPLDSKAYVQGVVGTSGAAEKYVPRLREVFPLDIPDIGEQVAINCHEEPILYTPDSKSLDGLYPGDIVRAQVLQRPPRYDNVYTGGPIIYVISHEQ